VFCDLLSFILFPDDVNCMSFKRNEKTGSVVNTATQFYCLLRRTQAAVFVRRCCICDVAQIQQLECLSWRYTLTRKFTAARVRRCCICDVAQIQQLECLSWRYTLTRKFTAARVYSNEKIFSRKFFPKKMTFKVSKKNFF